MNGVAAGGCDCMCLHIEKKVANIVKRSEIQNDLFVSVPPFRRNGDKMFVLCDDFLRLSD